MRKTLLIIAIAILVFTPVIAYVIVANSPARVKTVLPEYRQELTQQLQMDLQESFQKMIDLRKESINKMVADGLLSEERGQQALAQLDAMAAYHAENGYAFGYGMMGGCHGGFDADDAYDDRGSYGPGMMRGYDWN